MLLVGHVFFLSFFFAFDFLSSMHRLWIFNCVFSNLFPHLPEWRRTKLKGKNCVFFQTDQMVLDFGI